MTDVKSSSGGWESMRSSVGILLGIGSVGDSPLSKLNDLCKSYEDAQKDIEKYDVDNVINFEHPNKKSTYDALYDDFRDLYEYTSVAHDLVAEHIDDPFYKKIDEFVEDLSNLSISDYATKNTIGTKERKLTEVGYRTYKETQVVKDKISIDDLFDKQSILGKQLQADYDLYEKEFSGKKSDKLKYEEYKSGSLNIGGFSYQSIREKQESKELWVNISLAVVTVAVSFFCPPAGVVLGLTIGGMELKSSATGKDWISGRELSTSERWTRFGLAGLSIVLDVGAARALSKGSTGLKLGVSQLDNVDDVVKGAKELGKGRQILSNAEAEEYAFNAINGADDASSIVLGKYDKKGLTGYIEKAKELGAQYFNIDNWGELSKVYDDEEIWKINEKFLDIQIGSGRDIYFSHNPFVAIGEDSFYAREIGYLQEHGFTFEKIGDIWHVVR